MAPAIYSSDSFTLTYLAEQNLLIGRWLRPVILAELQTHYEALLAEALVRDNCHHWLLDVRRRSLADPAAMRWFGDVFSLRLPQALGRPVALAYFAMVNQETAMTDPTLEKNVRQGSLHGAHYHYFDQEGEAIAWLLQQP